MIVSIVPTPLPPPAAVASRDARRPGTRRVTAPIATTPAQNPFTSCSPTGAPTVRALDELYAELGHQVEKVVRAEVGASKPVVEDACQAAWSRLICRREHVREESVLGWLATTAIHEALRLIGRQRRETSLESELEQRGEESVWRLAPGPEELWETRERFGCLGALSPRQQRLVWLQGIGLSYEEMAGHESCTVRTVERQLLRAKRALRAGVA